MQLKPLQNWDQRQTHNSDKWSQRCCSLSVQCCPGWHLGWHLIYALRAKGTTADHQEAMRQVESSLGRAGRQV